jgi:hypothetical protein
MNHLGSFSKAGLVRSGVTAISEPTDGILKISGPVAFHDSVALKTPFEFRPAAHSDHEAPFLAGVAAPPEVMADVLSDIAVALF